MIVLAHGNNDVSHPDIQQFCKEVNIIETISWLHGCMAVPMHQRGSTAVDTIFMSLELLPHARGGFLAFGEATYSNHRVVWIDIRSKLVGLHHLETIMHTKAH